MFFRKGRPRSAQGRRQGHYQRLSHTRSLAIAGGLRPSGYAVLFSSRSWVIGHLRANGLAGPFTLAFAVADIVSSHRRSNLPSCCLGMKCPLNGGGHSVNEERWIETGGSFNKRMPWNLFGADLPRRKLTFHPQNRLGSTRCKLFGDDAQFWVASPIAVPPDT